MIIGNITLSSRPNRDDLKSNVICGDCLCECEEVEVDESFSDSFGLVTAWGVGSSCCGGECYEGEIFLDRTTRHTARKDHKDGKIKKGQRYKAHITKGYYIDDSGKHHGIYEYSKRVLQDK